MVSNFCTLARLVLMRGDRCSVSFEWPKGSSGWKHKSVIAQLQAIGLCHSTQVDGCAVGVAELKSGNPIPKPWTIKSSSAIVVAHLSTLRCPGQSPTHIHGTCQGSDTLRTGFYTQHFATEIVSALNKHHEAHEPCPHGTCTAEACKASVGSLSPSSSVVSSFAPASVLVLPAASVDKVIAPSNAYELAAENALDYKSAESSNDCSLLLRSIAKLLDNVSSGNNRPAKCASSKIAALPVLVTPQTSSYPHRQKADNKPESLQELLFGLVVRPILPSSSEFRCPAAQAALLKELKRLVDGEVWLVNTVRNWSDVVKSGVPSLVTRVHAIMGQKNSEMGVPGEFKARIVIGGNNMSSSDGRPAHELFQEVSGPPSAMSGTRGVLASAALMGNQITVRGAESAYIQASINKPGRPQTWIRLPRNLQPASWFDA